SEGRDAGHVAIEDDRGRVGAAQTMATRDDERTSARDRFSVRRLARVNQHRPRIAIAADLHARSIALDVLRRFGHAMARREDDVGRNERARAERRAADSNGYDGRMAMIGRATD